MEVILIQDVDRIGKAGQVIKVKDGFARNFLIPNGLASPKTQGNLKKIEKDKETKALQLEKTRKAAEEIGEKLKNLSLTIPVLTKDEDKLYGSITAVELENALKDEGFAINKSAIVMAEPIKALGIYEVPIKLHPEVSANVKVWIVKK